MIPTAQPGSWMFAAFVGLHLGWVSFDWGVGTLVTLNGELVSSLQVEVDRTADGDLVDRIYIMRNPEKLAHLASLLE